MTDKKPVLLMILDGFGLAPAGRENAISRADTKNLDAIFESCPKTTLKCSGLSVGLPEGQMGNSEVGHTNIGAGRIVYQDLTRISKEIDEGTFFQNPVLLSAMERAKNKGAALHFMGLLSDGGVHSHNTHLYALLKMAAGQGLKKVFIHAVLDGRDTLPESGKGYMEQLEEQIKEIKTGEIVTISGRYYAMDRDKRYDRVKRAYDAVALGRGQSFDDALSAVQASYGRGLTDEFAEPVVKTGYQGVAKDDSFIFFNFRPDRAREITRALVDENFAGFAREKGLIPLHYVCLTEYDKEIKKVDIAFGPESLDNTLGEYVSKQGLSQLRIAETEKYAHVTFFFNGGEEQPYPGEDRCLIPSPKVATYDQKPEMSAYEVAGEAVRRIESKKYDLIVLNFANCDMVGHTGVMEAAVSAVGHVDKCAGMVRDALVKQGGILIVTADHGNAEKMIDSDGVTPFTAHTVNEVPFAVCGADVDLKPGRLCDIAPTVLSLMGIKKPPEMTGVSLIV